MQKTTLKADRNTVVPNWWRGQFAIFVTFWRIGIGYIVWALPAIVVIAVPYFWMLSLFGGFQQNAAGQISIVAMMVLVTIVSILIISPVLKAYFDLVKMCGIFGQRAALIDPDEIKMVATRMNAEYRSGYCWVLRKMWSGIRSVSWSKPNDR